MTRWDDELNDNYSQLSEKNESNSTKYSSSDDAHWLDQLINKHPSLSLDIGVDEKEIILNLSQVTTNPEYKKKGQVQIFPKSNPSKLIFLSLANNLITDLEIRDYPELKYVIVSHNLLTKLTITNCPNITDLYLHKNQFTDETFPDLEQFPKLENVTFYDAHYQPKKPSEVSDEIEPADPNYKGNYLSPAKVAELEQYCQSKGIKLECKPFFSLLSQEERERADLIIRALKYYKRDEEDKETMDEEEFTPEELEIFKNTTKIDLNELIHSEGRKRINGHLYLDHFPNLETLICNNQGLMGELELNICPELKFVYCNDNQIEEINLTGLEQLEYLYCSNNNFYEQSKARLKLKIQGEEKIIEANIRKGLFQLDLTHIPNLKHLECQYNCISSLNVQHLKKLKFLKCFNCRLTELDVSGLKNLKELYCANNWLFNSSFNESYEYDSEDLAKIIKKIEDRKVDSEYVKKLKKEKLFFEASSISLETLNVQGCENLEILDCAENKLRELDISNLTKLRTVSCRQTCVKSINATNCKRLEYINYANLSLIAETKKYGELDVKPISLYLQNCHKLKQLFLPIAKIKFSILQVPRLKTLTLGRDENNKWINADVPNLRKKTLEKLIQILGPKYWICKRIAANWIKKKKVKKKKKTKEDKTAKKKHQLATKLGYYNWSEATSPRFRSYFQKSWTKSQALSHWHQQIRTQTLASAQAWLEHLFQRPNYSLAEANKWNDLIESLGGERMELPLPPTPPPDHQTIYQQLLTKINQGQLTNPEEITNSPLSTQQKEELVKLLAQKQSEPNANSQTPEPTPIWPWVVIGSGIVGVLVLAWWVRQEWRRMYLEFYLVFF